MYFIYLCGFVVVLVRRYVIGIRKRIISPKWKVKSEEKYLIAKLGPFVGFFFSTLSSMLESNEVLSKSYIPLNLPIL